MQEPNWQKPGASYWYRELLDWADRHGVDLDLFEFSTTYRGSGQLLLSRRKLDHLSPLGAARQRDLLVGLFSPLRWQGPAPNRYLHGHTVVDGLDLELVYFGGPLDDLPKDE